MKPAVGSIRFAFLMSFIGIAGVWIILYTTRWGIGLFGWDSFSYIAGARNLAEGHGYVFPYQNDQLTPITHFPPGMSSVLAVFEWLGVDALAGARLFNALLFGMSAVLLGLTIRASGQSVGFAFLGALLFLSSATMIEIYSLAMSEGFYIFLTLLGFLLLYAGLDRNSRYIQLAAVLVFGVAGLTRSVANAAAALIAYFLWSKKPVVGKCGEAILFGVLSLLPAMGWAAYTYRINESVNDRQLGFYPLVLKNYYTAIRTIFTWILPDRFVDGYEGLYGIFLLAISSGVVLVFSWSRIQIKVAAFDLFRPLGRFHFLDLLYASYLFLYPAAIFLAKTFFDPAIGMSDRILSPLLPGLIVIGLRFLSALWKTGSIPLRGISLAVVAYLLFFNFYFARYSIAEFHRKGLGLGRTEVQNSAAIQALPELARNCPVFSNDPFSLYFFTGQVGYRLNGFSPEKAPSGAAILAVFDSGEEHPVYRKHSANLELLVSDPIASLYIFRSGSNIIGTEAMNCEFIALQVD